MHGKVGRQHTEFYDNDATKEQGKEQGKEQVTPHVLITASISCMS